MCYVKLCMCVCLGVTPQATSMCHASASVCDVMYSWTKGKATPVNKIQRGGLMLWCDREKKTMYIHYTGCFSILLHTFLCIYLFKLDTLAEI